MNCGQSAARDPTRKHFPGSVKEQECRCALPLARSLAHKLPDLTAAAERLSENFPPMLQIARRPSHPSRADRSAAPRLDFAVIVQGHRQRAHRSGATLRTAVIPCRRKIEIAAADALTFFRR